MFNSGKNPETIVEEKGLKVINDQEEILNIVSEVLKKNVKSVEDYKNGKRKAFGFW